MLHVEGEWFFIVLCSAFNTAHMKEHLLHFLTYNDWANKTLLNTILELPEKEDTVAMFSHMILAQDKWYNRLIPAQPDDTFQWQGISFGEQELLQQWERSVGQWLGYLNTANDEELEGDIIFTVAATGQKKAVKIKDVLFQLNCHNVHHRAQINKMVSGQGMKVPVTDYIFTALRDMK
jgi:uncharacterized damage-inducible protein DinB